MKLPRRRPATLVVLVGLWAGLLGAAGSAPAQGGGVKEGQPAPNVELPATQIGTVLPDKKGAKTLSLKDLEGKKNVVLYFYPKAMTGG